MFTILYSGSYKYISLYYENMIIIIYMHIIILVMSCCQKKFVHFKLNITFVFER